MRVLILLCVFARLHYHIDIFWHIRLILSYFSLLLDTSVFYVSLILRIEVSVIIYINQFHRVNINIWSWYNTLNYLKHILHSSLKVWFEFFKSSTRTICKHNRVLRSLARSWEMDNACSRFLLMHTLYHTFPLLK